MRRASRVPFAMLRTVVEWMKQHGPLMTWLGVASLGFLVVIHKLEYFLNSKIIGERIKTPMWLTLLGLVVGERLMGIPGMILAPVVLDYIKDEAKRIKIAEAASAEDSSRTEK